MDMPHGGASSLESLSLSPLGDACFRMDLTAIHEILETIGYTDDDGTTNELSFQMWTNQMQETLDSEKKGHTAFRQEDFSTAIDCYTQALVVSPTWPTAFYLQAAALFALGKENEAQEALKDGSSLEVKEKLLAKTDV